MTTRQLSSAALFSTGAFPIRSYWTALLDTERDLGFTAARLALGVMILPHGLQLMFGLFGGPGIRAAIGGFGSMGIPPVLAFAAIATQVVGGIALITGTLGRLAALGVGSTMVVAVLMVHLPNGFFMNWSGTLPPGTEGWEFHMLAIALAVVVLMHGSGAVSVDRALSARR
jgi:putative oxidoreductase